MVVPNGLAAAAAGIALLALQASCFSPTASRNERRPAPLFDFIKGEALGEEPVNENEGGVGLTKRTAVKISGVSRRGEGSDARELLRYERMREIERGAAESVMEGSGCRLLCSGTGRELYQDPGPSTNADQRVVRLAPIEAARAALSSASSAAVGGDDASVVFNFLGGDELIMGEVLEACDVLTEGLDLPEKTRFKFNSVSFGEIPADVCSVMVVTSAGGAGGLEGADRSVARGELYVRDGKWVTVDEGDITTATN